ncbi:outer membrane protein assembly factor BamB family protein [Paenibacillus phocaensis]|uniref:outer membrane protein assembly factor BamB family protein n=1 Tax=Paenibacillus phocaensis TaxID=1776378 RepID=UPI0003AA5BEA|nr:PQQ-binding-like beta-propeller repeat protein [Paenibacillus phocaensis]
MEKRVLFNQNQTIGGFMEGGYDVYAYQPSQTNWVRHSLISAPNELKIQWKVKVPSSLQECSAVLGRNGEIYFGSLSGDLYCYSSEGELVWKLKLGSELSSPAIGADQRIYVAAKMNDDSEMSYLYAISADAIVEWKCELNQLISYPPMLDSAGNIYVTTYGKQMCCINPDGIIQWTTSTDYLLSCSPVITSKGHILINEGGLIHCLNLSGQKVWRKETGAGIGVIPIVLSDDSYLTTGSINENMKLLKLNSLGECVWAFPEKEDYSLWGSPVISRDGIIYIAGSEYRFQAIDVKSQSLLWESRIEGTIGHPPLISNDNKLIIASSGGNIPRDAKKGLVSKMTLLNETGELISEVYLPGEVTSPCLGQGNKVYITTNIPLKNHGYLYCIG